MNKMHVNADGEIELSDEILTFLNLRKGEDVIFFEEGGKIIIANAKCPFFQITLEKNAAKAI